MLICFAMMIILILTKLPLALKSFGVDRKLLIDIKGKAILKEELYVYTKPQWCLPAIKLSVSITHDILWTVITMRKKSNK